MRRTITGAAIAAPFLFGSGAAAQSVTAPRNAAVDASGARGVRVEAGAGTLRVEGKAGLRQVQVHGTARASSESILRDIKLIAERRGDEVFIKSEMPEQQGFSWSGSYSASLDLVVEVPAELAATITDGSGDLEILNVGDLVATDGSGDVRIEGAGSVRLLDGSGDILIENARGDVTVRDGSGDMEARNVSGSFTVESDGSGGIHASDVKGSVVVENDGSGEINAVRVGRDFTVRSKGSGSVSYSGVTGRIDVPERNRDRD